MIKIGKVIGDVIEAGGVKNVTNNYYSEASPVTKSEQNVNAAIDALLQAKGEDGKPLMTLQEQWWAVYRVLNELCNYPNKMTDFCRLMTDMGAEDFVPPCKYSSLKSASLKVPLLSGKVHLWKQFENLSEQYKVQVQVAGFLIEKLGFQQ